MYFKKVWTIIAIFSLQMVFEIRSTPIARVDLGTFDDNWNSKIQRHQEPLLGQMIKNHVLPPIGKNDYDESKPARAPSKSQRTAKKLGNAAQSMISCPMCKLAVGLLKKEVLKNHSFEDITKKFVAICTTFKVATESVCTGVFNAYGPAILSVLSVIEIGPLEICTLVLGEACGEMSVPSHEWEVVLPDIPKPNVTARKSADKSLPTFKVLHLSDTHYDPYYREGSVVNCQEPLCCRPESTPPKKGEAIYAGKWGSYEKCDSPQILLENLLSHIAEEHADLDFIIWTGDLPPHDIWNQTKESNLDVIQAAVEQIFEYFPNVPIFPALGNHESFPAGNFAPPWIHEPDYSIYWLYTRLADQWRKWLPASSGRTVLRGGFYSILIRPGFRIISLNTNYCHTLSWWLIVNSTDPAKELEWLVNELQFAEDNNEMVHIIGHIAPGSSDCMKVWSYNFNRIVERYENTIVAQFYGHSHADEFEVFYDLEENSRPISVAYLGPSVTTYDNYNPAYRIYYIAGDYPNSTREVLDHETWTMDLEEANNIDEPHWYRLYSAKNAYNIEDLSPNSWNILIERLVEDPDLFDIFYKMSYRDSPKRPLCNNKCKLQTLCNLRCGRSNQRHKLCHDLEIIFGD